MTINEAIHLRPQAVHSTDSSNALKRRLDILSTTFKAAAVPYISQNRALDDFAREYNPFSPKLRMQEFLNAGRVSVQNEFAERHANEYRAGLLETRFGQISQQAQEDDPHHGVSHGNRTESNLEAALFTSPNLHFRKNTLRALFLFPFNHDRFQSYRHHLIEEAKSRDQTLDIDAKAGHGTLAAAFMLMTTDVLEKSLLGIRRDTEKGRKRAKAAADEVAKIYTMLTVVHDVPEHLKEALGMVEGMEWLTPQEIRASAKNAEDPEGTKILTDALLNKTPFAVNIFHLSPKDMFDILHEIAQRKKMDTYYGFGKEIENDPIFQEKIKQLSTDNTPLLANASPEVIEEIRQAAILAADCDVMEMIGSESAYMRKLLVPRSKNRVYSWTTESERTTDITDQQIQQLLGPQEASYVTSYMETFHALNPQEQAIVKNILLSNGNSTKSDVERATWEAYHGGTLWENTAIGDSPVAQNRMRDYHAMTFVMIRTFSQNFMQGDGEVTWDTIHNVYEKRRDALRDDKKKSSGDIARTLSQVDQEEREVYDAFINKPGGLHKYSLADRQSMLNVVKMVERAFWIKQGITNDSEREKISQEYLSRYFNGDMPVMTKGKYDTTSPGIESIGTINPIPALQYANYGIPRDRWALQPGESFFQPTGDKQYI